LIQSFLSAIELLRNKSCTNNENEDALMARQHKHRPNIQSISSNSDSRKIRPILHWNTCNKSSWVILPPKISDLHQIQNQQNLRTSILQIHDHEEASARGVHETCYYFNIGKASVSVIDLPKNDIR
jgi:hypothetical protein